jgi:DNA-binding NarL/FixJ family response regulator
MSDQGNLRPAYLRLMSGTSALGRSDAVVDANPGGQHVVGTGRLIQVLVAEARALLRAGYRALLESQDRIAVVGEAATAREATALAAEMRPDVLLLDLALPGLDDLETIARTVSHPAFARVAVLAMATSADDERVFTALRAGAVGVLAEDVESAELIGGIYALARGEALIPARSVRRLLRALPREWPDHRPFSEQLEELTDRERMVVALVGTGLSNAEIAEKLVISPATAKTHVSHAMAKVGAHHRSQLVVLAYETGLVRQHHGTPTRRAG